MSDNVQFQSSTLATPASGVVIATDDDGTAQHQYVKLEFGGDGTFTKVTSSVGLPVGDAGGTLTVDAPVGTPVFVRLSDGSAAITTLAVSLASVPSHAVTNAGTFATQDSQTVTEDAASAGAEKLFLAGAVRRDTAASSSTTDGDYSTVNTDATGRLWTHAGLVDTLTTITNVVHVDDNSGNLSIDDGGNSITVDYATTGSGNATGALRVELANNGTGVIATLGTITNVVHVDDNSGSLTVDYATTGSGNATGALRVELANNGTGVLATVGAVTAITNALPAGTNLIADVGIQPRTTLGLDTFMASGSDGSSILVATKQAVKASAGKVYGWFLYNPEAAVTFVHFYDAGTGAVTVGTTNPLFSLPIPAGAAANVMSDIGITFGTAITVSATTTAGGSGAPATGVSAQIWYK